jgi:lysophospholipase L1-like esterase
MGRQPTRTARRIGRRSALVTAAAIAVLGAAVPAVQGAVADEKPPARCEGSHWVAAWTAPAQSSSAPARTFSDQSVRAIVTPHTAGSALRVHLGNRFGTSSLTIDAATVGAQSKGAAVAAGSLRTLTFGGASEVVIAPGDDAVSDPLFLDIAALRNLLVSFHVAGTAPLDYHQWAQQTTWVAGGEHTAEDAGAAYTEELTSSYGVAAVDVLTSRAVGTVVALGDSITDGIGSSPTPNRRWPDQLARRLLTSSTPLSVVNAGIGGNRVAADGATARDATGPSAVHRVTRDALSQPGVTDLVVFEGINDISTSQPGDDVAGTVIDGYRAIIDAAHAAGVRVIGATITPAALVGEKEAARQTINRWIRTSGELDGIVDFDAAVRDPGNPTHVPRAIDAGYAHLTDAGYRSLANAIDPRLFQGTGCGA